MTFENGDILLCHVRIPYARQVISATSDQQIQISIKIETFASLRRQTSRAIRFDQFCYFVQSKDVRLFQFVDRGDDQRVSTVATRCDDRIVVRNVKNLSDVFAMHCAHAMVSHEFLVFSQVLEGKKATLASTLPLIRLTSQKIRWLLVEPVLSDLVASFFRRIGSNNELIGFLKYKM